MFLLVAAKLDPWQLLFISLSAKKENNDILSTGWFSPFIKNSLNLISEQFYYLSLNLTSEQFYYLSLNLTSEQFYYLSLCVMLVELSHVHTYCD